MPRAQKVEQLEGPENQHLPFGTPSNPGNDSPELSSYSALTEVGARGCD